MIPRYLGYLLSILGLGPLVIALPFPALAKRLHLYELAIVYTSLIRNSKRSIVYADRGIYCADDG